MPKMVQSTRTRSKRKVDGKKKNGSKNSKEYGLVPVSVNLYDAKTKLTDHVGHTGQSIKPSNCAINTNKNSKNIYKVSKKTSANKRAISPVITRSVAIQRQTSRGAVEGAVEGSGSDPSRRSNDKNLDMVSDWLTNFQLGNVSTEGTPAPSRTEDGASGNSSAPTRTEDGASGNSSAPTRTEDGASGNPPHHETTDTPMEEEDIPGPSSPLDSSFGGPSSVGSSISAGSPSSSGTSDSVFQCQAISSRSSSFASQEEQPDSTTVPSTSTKPPRTRERKEKQRVASAKSRRKKQGETDELKQREAYLIEDNARLNGKIEELEAEKQRYLSGAYEVDDNDIIDPQDETLS